MVTLRWLDLECQEKSAEKRGNVSILGKLPVVSSRAITAEYVTCAARAVMPSLCRSAAPGLWVGWQGFPPLKRRHETKNAAPRLRYVFRFTLG